MKLTEIFICERYEERLVKINMLIYGLYNYAAKLCNDKKFNIENLINLCMQYNKKAILIFSLLEIFENKKKELIKAIEKLKENIYEKDYLENDFLILRSIENKDISTLIDDFLERFDKMNKEEKINKEEKLKNDKMNKEES